LYRVLHCLALTAAVAVGSTGSADLLVLSSPSGPSAMMYGPAGRALASGPGAILGNPALAESGFAASGGRWNLSTTAISASGGISPGRATLAAGILYIGRGDLTGRDPSGEVTEGYSFSTGCALAGASFPLWGWLRAGLSAGVAWEDPGDGIGTGITAGVGIAGEPTEDLRFGAGVTGLGAAPSWNGIRKAMPTTVSTGVEWSVSTMLNLFAGCGLGFSTCSSFGGGANVCIGDLSCSAGYAASPTESEITGIFGGLRYVYRAGGTYTVEAAFSQRRNMDWPVMAGISVNL
jgi:hypothetical protein